MRGCTSCTKRWARTWNVTAGRAKPSLDSWSIRQMSFFGFGPGQQQNQGQNVQTTAGGVPQDAIARLRRMAGEGGAPMFTSDLSVSEFVLLDELQMQPLGLVLGSSIYHVGFQLGNYFQNQELAYLSQAMYQARELAMSSMEEEAEV